MEEDERRQLTKESLSRWAEELEDLAARLAIRDQVADERDRMADERDRVADERERVADQRESIADQREKHVDTRVLQLIALQEPNDELARKMGLSSVSQYQRATERIARARSRLETSSGRLNRSEAAIERGVDQDRRAQAEIDREIASTERHTSDEEPVD